jgi:hypothetical protein
MKVFISWSGDQSHQVAIILKKWLQSVIQRVDVYVSSEDIEKGTRWFGDVSRELEQTNFGIVCITRENKENPWLLFEAGALSKQLDQSRVSPFLVDISATDIVGPLAQFQATAFTKEDIYKLVKTVNKNSTTEALLADVLDQSFEKWWPDLETGINDIKKKHAKKSPESSIRSDRELIEEILKNTRAVLSTISEGSSEIPVFARDRYDDLVQRLIEMKREARMNQASVASHAATKLSGSGEIDIESSNLSDLATALRHGHIVTLARPACTSELSGKTNDPKK